MKLATWRNAWRLYALSWILVLIPACAQLGIQAPRNLGDSIAYGYSSLASVRQTAAQLLSQNVITLDDATKVQAGADQARTALDSARTAYGSGNTAQAQSYLSAATALLTQLQAYLQSKQGAK